MLGFFFFFCPDGITPNSSLTGPIGVEHSGEGIVGRRPRSHNAKLFERIEHSGSR